MIGISAWDYIFIRTCIFLLHLVAPLSVVYSLVSWLIHLPFHIPHVLEVWLALEAVFYLLVYLPRKNYLQTVVTHPATGRDDRRRLFWRCHGNIPDPDRYLTRWFRDAPTAEIKRENVKDFFRWAFLNSGEPGPAYDEELEEYIGEMEKLLGRKLEPGRGNAQCLRLTLDKVEMLHRSLIWYLCVFVVDTLASIYLRYSPSTSTARRCSGFSPSSPRAPSLSSPPIVPLRELSLTGTGRTPPGPDSPSYLYTVSVLDSTCIRVGHLTNGNRIDRFIRCQVLRMSNRISWRSIRIESNGRTPFDMRIEYAIFHSTSNRTALSIRSIFDRFGRTVLPIAEILA